MINIKTTESKLVYKAEEKRYYFICAFSDRNLAKQLKFKWEPKRKLWFTEDWYKARKLLLTIRQANPQFNPGVLPFMQHRLAVAKNNLKVNNALFPYQREGVAKIIDNKVLLLADEQGLGKTIQVIEALNIIKPKKTLIICPASLKLNWSNEFMKWQNYSSFHQVVKNGRDTIQVDVANIVIVNYDLLSKSYIRDQLTDFNPEMVICDEAHYLKNAKTARTKSAFKLMKNADRKVMLTGTPMLNRPIELYPMLKALSPQTIQPYADYRSYGYKFCNAYEGRWGFDVSGHSNTDELNERLRYTFMVRRLKKDVLEELPDKQVSIIPFEQNGETKEIVKQEGTLDIEKLKRQPELGNIGELAALRHKLALAKLPQCVSHIETLLESVHKIVIFAYHRKVCEELSTELFNYNPQLVMGGTSMIKKQQAVDNFQKDKDARVFIGQINSAGAGLTLTAASTVVFVETTWTPGEIHQAIDRCHRIGQKDSVLAQFLVVENSLDETMLKTIFDKTKVINEVLK